MNNFILGLVLGSILTGTVVGAGSFYDSSGQPNAPRGSIESFDYYRQRQQFLDLNAMRRNADEQRLHDQRHPCGR